VLDTRANRVCVAGAPVSLTASTMTGRACPRARRAEVFGRGRRLDEAVAGSGLGLTIAGELAELHGGGIELADSPLGGPRAVLTLPAAS